MWGLEKTIGSFTENAKSISAGSGASAQSIKGAADKYFTFELTGQEIQNSLTSNQLRIDLDFGFVDEGLFPLYSGYVEVDEVVISEVTDNTSLPLASRDEKVYSYGFGGQERDDEVSGSGNSYTAEFWQYDSRLGRRWNVDPIVKPHESPYAAFANNPIWFVDPSGADTSFTDQESSVEFRETLGDLDNKIDQYDKKIDKKMARWAKKGYDNDRRNKRMAKKIGRLNGNRAILLDTRAAFDDVINDEMMFHFTSKPNTGNFLAGGDTYFDLDNLWVNIDYYRGNIGSFLHEVRHGSGFVNKEWGWDLKNDVPIFYDLQDERDAYDFANRAMILMYHELPQFKPNRQIRNEYSTKSYIINEFKQHCVEGDQCQ